MRCLMVSQYSADSSMPMVFLSLLSAAIMVVPLPQKGSRIVSPGSVKASMNHSGSHRGKVAACLTLCFPAPVSPGPKSTLGGWTFPPVLSKNSCKCLALYCPAGRPDPVLAISLDFSLSVPSIAASLCALACLIVESLGDTSTLSLRILMFLCLAKWYSLSQLSRNLFAVMLGKAACLCHTSSSIHIQLWAIMDRTRSYTYVERLKSLTDSLIFKMKLPVGFKIRFISSARGMNHSTYSVSVIPP